MGIHDKDCLIVIINKLCFNSLENTNAYSLNSIINTITFSGIFHEKENIINTTNVKINQIINFDIFKNNKLKLNIGCELHGYK